MSSLSRSRASCIPELLLHGRLRRGLRDHIHCQAMGGLSVFEAAMLSEEPVSCGLVCDMFEDGGRSCRKNYRCCSATLQLR